MIPRFKVAYSKVSKRFVAKRVKTEKSYNFMRQIALKSYYRAVDSEKYDQTKRLARKRALFVAPKERPCNSEVIEENNKV